MDKTSPSINREASILPIFRDSICDLSDNLDVKHISNLGDRPKSEVTHEHDDY